MKLIDIPSYLQDTLKLKVKKVSHDEMLGVCPAPWHEDHNASWYVNSITGMSYCHSCGFKANLEYLTRIVLGHENGNLTYRVATGRDGNEDEYLQSKIKSIRSPASSSKIPIDQSSFNFYINNFSREPLIQNSIISKNKNFIKGEHVFDYQIKHWTLPGAYYNRIAIPIFDFDGKIQNINFRRINDSDNPKYLSLPSNATEFKSDELLFLGKKVKDNLNDILINKKKLDYIFITEGIFDSIYLDSHGYNSCSIFTNSISYRQIELILYLTDLPIIFFDGDERGVIGLFNCRKKIRNYNRCESFFEKKIDPDEFTDWNRLDFKLDQWLKY